MRERIPFALVTYVALMGLHCQARTIAQNKISQTPFERACVKSGDRECSCDEGFTLDGLVCRDQNECALGTNDCDPFAKCLNLPGSFTCACPAGYAGDGRECREINECEAATALCDVHATCTNTLGSYRCDCMSGFVSEGLACRDINECEQTPCAANERCTNTLGGYTCSCDAPYFRDGDTCRRYRAFVLDDGGSFAALAPILAEELEVGPAEPVNYQDWDGVLPSPTPDVIFWLQGIDYASPTPSVVRDTLRSFVNNGGGLVRTEWAAWAIAWRPMLATDFAEDMMPVGQYNPTTLAYVSSNLPLTWRVAQPDHALASGLPALFAAKGSAVQLGLKPTARVIVEIEASFGAGPTHVPGLSYMSFGAGRIVHINHDLIYPQTFDSSFEAIRFSEAPLRRLFKNAALFAAKRQGPTP